MIVSVVTINLNRRDELRRTLESLRQQTSSDFELIVVDGGSTDGSLEVCEQYKDVIACLISEADDGIYDAWNKGIRRSIGSVIGLLNAGDEFHREVISNIHRTCLSFGVENVPIMSGRTFVIRHGSIKKTIGSTLSRNLLFGIGFAHPAMFVPKWVYENVGLYQRISIASDSQFILRCVKAGVPFQPIDACVYMDGTGLSQKAAVTGFSQYVEALVALGFVGRTRANITKISYALYRILVDLGLIGLLREIAANMRHFGILLLNIYQRVIFFEPLRRAALRSIGFSVHRTAFVSPGVTFYKRGNVVVGRGSVINRGVLLDNRGSITIGDGCSISHSAKLITGGHDIDSPYFEYFFRPLRMGNCVVIFAGAMVLPGTVLRDGVVVLPGSVIAGETTENGVYGGVPAKLIRQRRCNPCHRLNYHRPFAL